MSDFKSVKNRIKRTFDLMNPNGVMPDEVVIDDKTKLVERINFAEKVSRKLYQINQRAEKCPGANDIFSEFVRDAAIQTVIEMNTATQSTDRQRAQERVLDRALGKAVDRSVSVHMNVNDLSDEELNNKILQLLGEHAESIVNIKSTGKGTTPPLIVEEG